MAQVAPAPGTEDLGPGHAVGTITALHDGARRPCPVEARPTRSGVELRIGVEELGTTAGTSEDPLTFHVEEVARPRGLSAGTAQHGVLLRCELLLPLVVALGDLEVEILGLGGLAFEHGFALLRDVQQGGGSQYFSCHRVCRLARPYPVADIG